MHDKQTTLTSNNEAANTRLYEIERHCKWHAAEARTERELQCYAGLANEMDNRFRFRTPRFPFDFVFVSFNIKVA